MNSKFPKFFIFKNFPAIFAHKNCYINVLIKRMFHNFIFIKLAKLVLQDIEVEGIMSCNTSLDDNTSLESMWILIKRYTSAWLLWMAGRTWYYHVEGSIGRGVSIFGEWSHIHQTLEILSKYPNFISHMKNFSNSGHQKCWSWSTSNSYFKGFRYSRSCQTPTGIWGRLLPLAIIMANNKVSKIRHGDYTQIKLCFCVLGILRS